MWGLRGQWTVLCGVRYVRGMFCLCRVMSVTVFCVIRDFSGLPCMWFVMSVDCLVCGS